MSRTFDVPHFFRSPIISLIKHARRITDPRKRDLSPSMLNFGPVCFKIARHFGFCFGVENAIEIAYQALDENPDKRVFLLSEMIHNPHVNDDLKKRGVQFISKTSGERLIPFEELNTDDVVIVPAFGTTIEIENELNERKISLHKYDTTCPFVEKVWTKSEEIGRQEYTVIIHGKRDHEETRATFSHANTKAHVVVILDINEAKDLAKMICGEMSEQSFYKRFKNCYSDGFNPQLHLNQIGVVNQTTMLANETEAIANLLHQAMINRYGKENSRNHFIDTKDTLCYATKENQDATLALIKDGADFAIIVGGYNSSNTSHLVELCEAHMPTYFIRDASELVSSKQIRHLDIHTKTLMDTINWLPERREGNTIEIILTAGASCPDVLLDEVIRKIISWFPDKISINQAISSYKNICQNQI